MANRFWVGGSGTWDASNTANWSATTGGAGGASVPTSADNALFDSNSGTGTCTTNGTVVFRDATVNSTTLVLSFGGACTGRTIVLTSGSVLVNGNTLTVEGFSSTNSNTRTLNFGTGGKFICTSTTVPWNTNIATNLTISGTGTIDCTDSGATAKSILFGALSEANTIDVNVTAGTAAVTLTGSVKNLNFTGFAGSLVNGARTVYGNLTISSGMTLAAGASATTFAGTSGTKTITTNTVTLDVPLTFNGIGSTWSFADALTQGSTRAFTVTNGTVKLKAGATSTVGAFATSGTNQKYLQSTTAGSQATLSQASGTVSVSYLTIQDINATGGATWNSFITNQNIDAGNNAGWDFYVEVGRYIYTRRKNKRILL